MNFRRSLMRASALLVGVAALPAILSAQGGGGRGGPQEPPKNLQVLPKDKLLHHYGCKLQKQNQRMVTILAC